jgi:hypothetical protein
LVSSHIVSLLIVSGVRSCGSDSGALRQEVSRCKCCSRSGPRFCLYHVAGFYLGVNASACGAASLLFYCEFSTTNLRISLDLGPRMIPLLCSSTSSSVLSRSDDTSSIFLSLSVIFKTHLFGSFHIGACCSRAIHRQLLVFTCPHRGFLHGLGSSFLLPFSRWADRNGKGMVVPRHECLESSAIVARGIFLSPNATRACPSYTISMRRGAFSVNHISCPSPLIPFCIFSLKWTIFYDFIRQY